MCDELFDFDVLGHDLVALETGEALQTHVENGLGLDLRETEIPA